MKNPTESATIHKVANIRPHKKYVTGDGWKNDIALIKVNNSRIINVNIPH